MSVKQRVRIGVDLGMLALLPLLMGYSLIGEAVHEWLGVAMLLLFLLHHILNRVWFQGLFQGRYSGGRALRTSVNLLLLLVMLVQPASGILMSRHAAPFLALPGTASMARLAHLLGGYWGLLLMSFHGGMHGAMVLGMARKAAGITAPRAARTIFLRGMALLIGLYGIYAFFQRQIGSYLLLRNQFVFFDFSEPLPLFLLDYLAIMAFFALAGYYAAQGLRQRKGEHR